MSGFLAALIILCPLMAFALWLGFNLVLARWYGLDALKATSRLHRFRPGDWSVRSSTAGEADDDAVA